MILEEATYFKFGYYPYALSHGSNKRILAKCDGCGKVRIIYKKAYRSLCLSCSIIGLKNHLGHTHTDEAKRKMRENHADVGGEKHPRWRGGKKLRYARGHSKRKQLGFIPILSLNEGEVWHHFTNEHVIGIPEDIHQNYCGHNRNKHRMLVLEWLRLHDRVKYLIIQSFKNTLEGR